MQVSTSPHSQHAWMSRSLLHVLSAVKSRDVVYTTSLDLTKDGSGGFRVLGSGSSESDHASLESHDARQL
jgi:hypothetical protein